MDAPQSTSAPEVVRDNYIPIFDGQPASFREYRMRVNLYYKKMALTNKKTEATISLLTSLAGPVWKQVEHLADSAPDQEDGFEAILKELDRVYQYDARVEMPKAFEKFLYGLSRPAGQTLIHYCSSHREAARELEKHDVKLPDAVGGWLLLRRASLSQEQRQLVLSQLDNKKLSVAAVEQSLFYLCLAKTIRAQGPNPIDQPAEDEEAPDYLEPEYADETDYGYYEDDPEGYDEIEEHEAPTEDFAEPTYYGLDDDDEETEEAYAAYLDARSWITIAYRSHGAANLATGQRSARDLHRPTSPGGSPTKRQKGEAMMAGSRSDLRAATVGRVVGLQDGGASSMVGGHGFLMDVVQAFVEKGVHPDSFLFARTNKTFLFGGDNRSVADWCVHLPVWVGGIHGRIQCFLVSGEMPVLIGRPILKALKVKMDYDHDKVSIMGEPWAEALVGPKGEYLLALDDGLSPDTLDTEYAFDYSGSGNLAAAMAARGFQARTFDLPDWDFEKQFMELRGDHELLEATRDYHHHTHLKFTRRVFLRMSQYGIVVLEHPLSSRAWTTPAFHELGLPIHVDQCALGATLPNLHGIDTPIKKATKLVTNYRLLTETLGAYRCLEGAYYAYFVYAGSATEEALPASDVDMEEYDPSNGEPPEDDDLYPRTTAEAPELQELDLPTTQDIEAERQFGRGSQKLATSSTTTPAKGTSSPQAPPIELPGPVPTTTRPTGCLKKLECNTAAEATRIVARIHRNMGHPNNKDLSTVLAQSGASRMVYEAAQKYQCPTCKKLAPPAQVPKSTLRTTYRFNERLLADTIWLQVLDKTLPVITMMDAATRFLAARYVNRETTSEFLIALQRGWIRTFGPPTSLFVDSHRSWGSDEMMQFTTEHGIELIISPDEAHERLAQLERRHQVLRRAVELYLEDNPPTGSGPESLIEALTFVVPQLNQSLSVGGFSPTQWVLGYQPTVPGSLLDSNVNYSHLDPSTAFHYKMECRVRAATAVVKADNDLRLRRALLRQHRGEPPKLLVGQRCFYWREAAGPGPRIRWKGPATVVLVESQRGPQTPPTVYWLVHGNALIRAAPEHVRPDLENATLAADTPALHALVMKVQNRGTTVYVDLFRTNRKRRREDLADTDQEDTDHEGDNPPDNPPPPPGPAIPAPPPSASPFGRDADPGLAQHVGFCRASLTGVYYSYIALSRRHFSSSWTSSPPDDDDMVLAEAEDPDSEEDGDDDPDVDPDTDDEDGGDGGADGTSSTTAPSTSDRPGSVTGASSSTPPSNTENRSPGEGTQHRLHPIFEAGANETFNQKRARLDRSETISYGPSPRPPVHPVFKAPPFETFNQRRARLDRSYGPQPPPAGERPQPYPDQGPTTEHGFTVDVLDHETDADTPCQYLPEGWVIDEHGYMVLEEIYDTWEIKGANLIRHHYVARNTLFHPQETGDCPIPVNMLTKVRQSYQGGRCHQDRWRNSKEKEGIWWTGRTVFKIATRDRHMAQTAFYTSTGGAPTYGGPKEKRQKDAKTLNERALSLADRLAFIDAKRKELGSFFTNSVWEFGTESEAPPGRILKAHFILKWSKNPDGTPRAKARLIIQGFRDPDALAGLVDSTSPTLSRLGRTTLFSLTTLKQWSTFVADVSTAFLQGREHAPSRTLWVRLPADARQLLGVTDPKVCMLEQAGFTKHPLDACLFLYFAPDLRCAVGLHVDDLLGTSSPDNKDFIKKSLKELFSFRDYLEDQDEFEFLGVSVKKEAHGGHSCGHDNYLAKLKPITLDKGRMADPESPASDKERKQLRALLGALQWAATQTSPHLQTMTSMLAGEVPKAKISTILAANKMLRFAKSNSDIRLQYAPLGATVEEVTFVAYSDAAFASRTDLSSQGGYMICLSPRKVLEGTVCGYHLLDWRPFKLPRVARSTLAAEGQAASEAADCLHFAVVFWKAMLDPEFRISEVKPETYRWWSPCALIVDAKCLYDLLHREELYVSTAADKRTCLEALTTRDKLREIGGEARWVSSERQYADGLTKDSATQLLADRLRTHMHKIVADDTYQASRKKTAVDRQRSAQQFAQPKAGWTGRAAAFAAAALTVASQPAPTEAHRDDDVSGALTYYVPQTYSDYCETGYYIFLPILVIIFFIYVHPTSAIQRLITFTWWTRTTRITNDVATQTEDTASATTFTTAEGLALDLQLVRAYNQRLAAAVHRQQQALNYHTEYRLEHHHIGDLYVTPHGRAWHCSEDFLGAFHGFSGFIVYDNSVCHFGRDRRIMRSQSLFFHMA
ncbi:TY5A [Symbiodinium microadriaticum]|nr:TY5A [Symbiodinium microadriaticum]